MSLLTASIDRNSHNLLETYFIFLKDVLEQKWKTFNTKFGPKWKDQKSRYEERRFLAFFAKLLLHVRVKTMLKALELPKLSKKLSVKKSKGIWKKTLFAETTMNKIFWIFFTWNCVLQKKLKFCFSVVFRYYLQNFIIGGRMSTRL